MCVPVCEKRWRGVKGIVSGLVWHVAWWVGWKAGLPSRWLVGASPAQAWHLHLSRSFSFSLLGVTGWDIKTGVLINCATLPPAALNMLRPRQAVSHTIDSLALFLLHLSHLYHFSALFPSFSPICNRTLRQPNLLPFPYLFSSPLVFDLDKWKLIPTDKAIPWDIWQN